MCLDIEVPVKQNYEWQKRNMSTGSWTMEMKEEVHNTGLAFVWTKQQERDLREITKVVKDKCNGIERQNI
jgi:hypothetical protein